MAALAFHSSPAGRKFTDATLVQMHQQAGARGTEAEPDPASGELEQIPAFVAAALYPQSQRLLAPMPKDAPAVPSAMQTRCAAAPIKAPS